MAWSRSGWSSLSLLRVRRSRDGGSGAVRLAPAQPLDDGGRALAAADAHRHEAVACAPRRELREELDSQLRASRAERMAEGDRAPVRVRPLLVEAQPAHDGDDLVGERLVQF